MDRLVAFIVAEGATARDGSRLASIFATAAAKTDVEDSAAGKSKEAVYGSAAGAERAGAAAFVALLVPPVEFSA